MAKKILVIGSLNLDMRVDVDHMPAVGETILAKGMKTSPGGKGANQACALGKLGVNTVMLGAVGADSYADIQRQSLSNAGVDVSRLIVKEEASTGLALIPVNKEGDNSIIVVQGANGALTKEDIDNSRDLIESCDLVMFQLEIPLDVVCYAAKMAKELNKIVILDPAPVPEKFPEELYPYVDVIKPNETELGMLTKVKDARENLSEAAGVIRRKGVKNVLVSLGGDGVYVDSDECGTFLIPAHKVDVVDTTAAGDSFTAGLAAKLLEGENIKEAAKFANCVSAMVVTRAGAQDSIPTLKEVEAFMKTVEK